MSVTFCFLPSSIIVDKLSDYARACFWVIERYYVWKLLQSDFQVDLENSDLFYFNYNKTNAV